jgi:UDP-glucose 4-epimerase
MNILLTGASGFVGQNLVPRLLASGNRVTTLVRPGAEPIGENSLAYHLGSGNPLAMPAEIDAVVHLAQSRTHRSFPSDALEMFRVNVMGTQYLLEAAAAAGVDYFCLISSGTVYEPFEGPLVEDAPLSPRSYLGASKLASEIIAKPFAGLFKLSVLRLFTPYGPGQKERLLPELIRRVGEGQAVDLPINGDGLRFSPTYVDDISGVIEASLNEGWEGVFNVATPESITIAEASEMIGKKMGKPVSFSRKSASNAAIVPDLTRLAARIDLNAFHTFENGLTRTLADWPNETGRQGD